MYFFIFILIIPMDLLYDSIETILNDDLNNIVDIIIDKYGYLNDSITKQQLQNEFPLESIIVVKEFKQKITTVLTK